MNNANGSSTVVIAIVELQALKTYITQLKDHIDTFEALTFTAVAVTGPEAEAFRDAIVEDLEDLETLLGQLKTAQLVGAVQGGDSNAAVAVALSA